MPPQEPVCWNSHGARAEFASHYLTPGKQIQGNPTAYPIKEFLSTSCLSGYTSKCARSSSFSHSTAAWWCPAHLSRSCPGASARQTCGYKGFPAKRNTVYYTGGRIMQAGCPKAESELLKDSMAMNCWESWVPWPSCSPWRGTDESCVILRDFAFSLLSKGSPLLCIKYDICLIFWSLNLSSLQPLTLGVSTFSSSYEKHINTFVCLLVFKTA